MASIEIYTLTHNEEYLLPYFLKHYHFADKINVYDNYSTDKTLEICANNPKVQVFTYGYDQQDNDEMILVKNNCWKKSEYDFVVVVDVDEFLMLKEIPLPERVVYKATGWNMIGRDGQNFYDIKLGSKDVMYDKCCLFSPKIKEINYVHGAHRCIPTAPIKHLDAKLLHYCLLGEDYIVNRRKKWANRMSDNDKKHRWGSHYLQSEDEMRQLHRNALKQAYEII